MSARLLAAIGRPGVEAGVALPANHLVAVVLLGQEAERGFNDPAAQAQHEVQGGLLLDVVVGEGPSVLQLLTGEDETLLVGGDPLLIEN